MNTKLIWTPEYEKLSPLELLRLCGGYYECSRDAVSGKRTSPLVGYAGTYAEGLHYVGDVYCNIAAIERQACALRYISGLMDTKMMEEGLNGTTITSFCGAPEGGKALAFLLAAINNAEYIYPEKKVTQVATPGGREKSHLFFDRHVPNKGDDVVIVEDACNNFSTTAALIKLIEACGAHVVAIVCFLNRSETIDTEYLMEGEGRTPIPVIALVRKAFGQFKQDDPAVEADVLAGNVVWRPKHEWDKLAPKTVPKPDLR